MAFSDDTVLAAFRSAGGRCECTRSSHSSHTGRCSETFTWGERGPKWDAHHKVAVASGGSDALSNCEILCAKYCHPQVRPRT